jgi:regulator of sigma E protease
MSLVYILVLLGGLIFIHELGHFLFAKLFDVKVLRFSIGMGPKVVGFTWGETEYVVCALPLGGYVQMMGHSFESIEDMDEEERKRALMGKPIWQRSLVTLAGPLFNMLLPVAIYFFVTLGQGTTPPSQIGQVMPETPAAEAGLMPGDRIVAIDGTEVRYWYQITDLVKDAYDRTLSVTVRRDGQTETVRVSPEKKTQTDFLGLNQRTYGMLGIHLGTQGPTVALDDPDGPAAQAGLEHFDRIVAVDGQPVKTFHEIRDAIRDSGGEPLELLVLHRYPIEVSYAQFFGQRADELTVTPVKRDGKWTLGLDWAEMYITEVDEGSPAAKAGLRRGDEILSVDGRAYSNWSMMTGSIQNAISKELLERNRTGSDEPVEPSFQVTFERDGSVKETTLRPDVIEYTGESKQEQYRVYNGWGHMSDMVMPDSIHHPLGDRLIYAAERGVGQTWRATEMMITGFLRILQGRVSLNTLGGPIMIGELAAQAGRAGLEYFLQMMALISINLAIFNLLPIPVLDGGHLMFYAIEAVRRRPLSFRTRQILTYIGLALIIMLMLLAFKNDIQRNWQDMVDWLQGW